MFLLQIGFAIAAWKRGWRWWALLPLEALLGMSFFIGLAVTAAGGSVEKAMPVNFLLELGTLISLVVLALRKPVESVPANQGEHYSGSGTGEAAAGN